MVGEQHILWVAAKPLQHGVANTIVVGAGHMGLVDNGSVYLVLAKIAL
jgi:hypothetical protein